MMTYQLRPVVHVVGHYTPTCAGLDAIAEMRHFRELFWKSNHKLGVKTHFLMGECGDKRLNQDYVVGNIKECDIVVLLDPVGDVSTSLVAKKYVSTVKLIRDKIGSRGLVFAFQYLGGDGPGRHVRQLSLELRQISMWEISYAPINSFSDDWGVKYDQPVPEMAVRIVRCLLTGENPDVYEDGV